LYQKDMPVDGDELRHGTTYMFQLRVDDGLSWSPWSEFSQPLPVLVPPPRPFLPVQENPTPTPPPTVEVQLVREPSPAATALGTGSSDLRLRLRWPRFEGRAQEVEYRVLMWCLTPEQKQLASKRWPSEAKGRTGLPPVVGSQTFVASTVVTDPSATIIQVDDTSAAPRAVRPGDVDQKGPAGTAHPRSLKQEDGPQVIGHIRPFDPPARNAPKQRSDVSQDAKNLDFEVSVQPVAKGHGYVFAIEAKHSRGALGNLGDWSAPLFSRLIEFENKPRHLSVEIDARFGTMLFKGEAKANAKPNNEKIVLEAGAVTFLDEHKDLPKAAPLLTQPGGDPWPHGSSPKRFVMRTKNRSVYAERLPDTPSHEPFDLSPPKHAPEERPPDDDFREG